MDLWDNSKGSKFCIIGVLEVEEKDCETEK